MKRELRCHAYLRFVDDFLLFADDKATLGQWRAALIERLAQLRLTIHPGAQVRPVTEGIPFLGFVVYPDRRRLKRRKGIAFARQLRAKVQACRTGALPYANLTASVQGWVNHVSYAHTTGLRAAVLSSFSQER